MGYKKIEGFTPVNLWLPDELHKEIITLQVNKFNKKITIASLIVEATKKGLAKVTQSDVAGYKTK